MTIGEISDNTLETMEIFSLKDEPGYMNEKQVVPLGKSHDLSHIIQPVMMRCSRDCEFEVYKDGNKYGARMRVEGKDESRSDQNTTPDSDHRPDSKDRDHD